jgi:RNA polymerase sigma-70 factor (ECF subfamily)
MVATIAPPCPTVRAPVVTERQDEFEARFDELYSLAYGFAVRFLSGQVQSAQDAAQESLTRLFARWGSLVEHPNLAAWTIETTRRVCLEMVRKQKRRWPFRVDDVPAVEPGIEVDALADALSRLSEQQRLVVVARYYFEYSVSQTAELLGLTDSKVKDATHEAVTKLRRIPELRALLA